MTYISETGHSIWIFHDGSTEMSMRKSSETQVQTMDFFESTQ